MVTGKERKENRADNVVGGLLQWAVGSLVWGRISIFCIFLSRSSGAVIVPVML